MLYSGGPGVRMSGVRGGHFSGLYVNGSGRTNDPRNQELVRQRGIRIPKLPQDAIGLTVGLELERDILGNEITDRSGLGAIQLP